MGVLQDIDLTTSIKIKLMLKPSIILRHESPQEIVNCLRRV